MSEIKKVLVVGGGIGGLTAAIALGQKGIATDLVEIKPVHSVYGVGIIQPGNALRALKSLGLFEACLAKGFPVDDFIYFDQNEEPLARLRMRRIAAPDYPAANFLPRLSLHHVLEDAAKAAGANIRMGVTVARMSDDGSKVDVGFTDGTSGVYDLVIGSDGIKSQIRTEIFGKQFEPKYTGHGVWRVMASRPENLNFQSIHFGVGVKAGLVPLSKERMYLLVVTTELGNPWFKPEELYPALLERIAQFGGTMIPAVRDQLNEKSEIIYVPIEEVILPSPWYKGRIVLMGDAAHASAPHVAQGATMAIEDACVLAEELSQSQTIETALEHYMERRYKRCKFVQDLSRRTGEEGQLTDPAACNERNELIRKTYAGIAQPRAHENILSEPI